MLIFLVLIVEHGKRSYKVKHLLTFKKTFSNQYHTFIVIRTANCVARDLECREDFFRQFIYGVLSISFFLLTEESKVRNQFVKRCTQILMDKILSLNGYIVLILVLERGNKRVVFRDFCFGDIHFYLLSLYSLINSL